MKIDLQQPIKEAEALLASMRALHGTNLDEGPGRAARASRTEASRGLQLAAHKADGIRWALLDTHLSLRDAGGQTDTRPQADAAD
jgi:hypothetical protein